MSRGVKMWRVLLGGLGRMASTEAAAIVEFAVALPLLIVLVVGIYDFGGAFNMKQELTNAAREGARYGSTQPTNDLCGGCSAPPSVDAIHRVVDAYLLGVNIKDCGLTAATGTNGGGGFVWTFNANTGCGGTLQLTIQRDFPGPGTQTNGCYATSPPQNVYVLCTQVTINYPYQWHFNNVIGLLIPGAQLNLLSIKTQGTAPNTD